MNILISLLLVVLVLLTTGPHIYFVWKRKQFKVLYAQVTILTLTIILGVWMIFDDSYLTISEFFNMLSPLEK